jgi:hypothetical protein
VGFIEDDRKQLDRHDSKDTIPVTNRTLTPAFQNDAEGWKPVVNLIHPTKWTIAFGGRRLGEAESEARPQDHSVQIIGPTHIHSILTPVNQLPAIGKPDGRFSGNFGTVVRRPLVVVSEAHFNDPDHWTSKEPSPRAMMAVRKSFRETFRHLRQCAPSGDALKEDWKIPDSEIIVSKSYGSRNGEYLVETKVLHSKCLFSVDGDDFQSLGGNQIFYVAPDRDGIFLGLQWELLDTGDYDGDGRSEVIFYVAEGKDVDVVTEGYVLFYDGFRHSVRFVWQNH